MSFIITDKEIGSDNDLNFQLIGVVDMRSAVNNYSSELLTEFFLNDHPAKSFKLKPCLIKSFDKKAEHAPFGIFLAAKNVNPQSDRPLISDEVITGFKAKYPFVHLEESWSNWDDLLNFYKDKVL